MRAAATRVFPSPDDARLISMTCALLVHAITHFPEIRGTEGPAGSSAYAGDKETDGAQEEARCVKRVKRVFTCETKRAGERIKLLR